MLTWKTVNITDNAVGVLENLVPFVNYTISVRGFTEAGGGAWSEPAQLQHNKTVNNKKYVQTW